ncbi:hypothetical protein [Paraliomyxa miuraensis]|uniref:hypothetical protein n=1 Tax=Paraliomyxa miuraensis TaxID=376150 RepID=UPI00224D1E50|nr:hypothetical protein [Paraliomyxa miuraensis]MCX4244898.1 hypothetical protein [Paraliomyxa miuraensis]
MTIVSGLTGTLVGATLALWHQHASWRASQALVRSQRTSTALAGLPLRVGLPALVLVGLSQWSPVAMVAALVAFGSVEVLAGRRRLSREDA